MRPFALYQLRISLKRVDDLDGAVPGLCGWINNDFGPAFNRECPRLFGRLLNRIQPPVLGFKNQDAAAWVDHDKIRVRLFGTDGDVVPEHVVVIEFLLQPLGQTTLTCRHPTSAGSHCRNQYRHVVLLPSEAEDTPSRCFRPVSGAYSGSHIQSALHHVHSDRVDMTGGSQLCELTLLNRFQVCGKVSWDSERMPETSLSQTFK